MKRFTILLLIIVVVILLTIVYFFLSNSDKDKNPHIDNYQPSIYNDVTKMIDTTNLNIKPFKFNYHFEDKEVDSIYYFYEIQTIENMKDINPKIYKTYKKYYNSKDFDATFKFPLFSMDDYNLFVYFYKDNIYYKTVPAYWLRKFDFYFNSENSRNQYLLNGFIIRNKTNFSVDVLPQPEINTFYITFTEKK